MLEVGEDARPYVIAIPVRLADCSEQFRVAARKALKSCMPRKIDWREVSELAPHSDE